MSAGKSQLSQEATTVLDHLVSVHVGYRATVPRKIAAELLLYCDATVWRHGSLLDLNTKSIGAGVHKVWLSNRE